MGKLVQQPSGYRSDLQGPYRSTVRHAAKRIKQSISQAFGVGWMNLMGPWLTWKRPIGLRTGGRGSTFEPAKTKEMDGWRLERWGFGWYVCGRRCMAEARPAP